MSIASAFDSAASLSKNFALGAMKAAAASRGASPYSAEVTGRSNPFGESQQIANAAKQYAAVRDIPWTAIRPIAVKVADQPVRIGSSATRSPGKPSPVGGLRTKSHTFLTAPPFIHKQVIEGMEPDLAHPLLESFESPNEYMTGWALRFVTAVSICATGDAYWFIDRTNLERLQFFYYPKTWVTPIHTNQRAFAGYKIKPPGIASEDLPPVPAEDMLHFRFPDPADPLGSISPLQLQSRAVNTDDEIQKAQFASMKNGIHPSVILRAGRLPGPPWQEAQGIVPVLTPEQRRTLLDTIRLHYAGSMHYGDPLIVDGMIEGVEQFSRSPAELGFGDGSMLTKNRIMQGIGTSPVVAGQSDNANRAGSYVAHDVFYRLTVNPILTLISETMTSRLTTSEQVPGRKLYVWIEEARADDADLELAKMTMANQAQAVTKNEIREFCGLPKSDDPEADKLPKPPEPPLGGSPAGASTTRPKQPALKKSAGDLLWLKFNPSQPRDKDGKWTTTHSAADIMAIVKASPQMGTKTDNEWEKYAAKWGVVGEFAKAQINTELLAAWAESGIVGTSRKLSDSAITDKQSGKSPIGPTIITRTPNERAQTFVIDGTHSLAARVRSYQKASADARDFSKSLEERRAARKTRDANAKVDVIISKEAAEYLSVELPSN